MKISVIGTGSWGTALAKVLVDNQYQVTLWGRSQEIVDEINQHRTNHTYLPGFEVPKGITAVTDLAECIQDTQMILIVLPTKAIRSFCHQLYPLLEKLEEQPLIVHATKGIEMESKLRVSQIIEEVFKDLPIKPITALSGPSHAEEVAKQDITMVTAACQDLLIAEQVQECFMNQYFRVYTNSDLIGVELGGALKNIIALASGMLSGCGFGDNAHAALMTRGLAEITRLGVQLGADPLTFSGLSGVGDLIVTCTSQHSRNFQAGYLLAKGKNKEKISDEVHMVVEGISTCQVAYTIAKELEIEMPITQELYGLIYEDAKVEETIQRLMGREGKQEANIRTY